MSSVVTSAPALYDADGRPLGRGGLAFTDEQAAAVLEREGPMLLSANAGSGKTAVLAERFVRGVVEDGCTPGELLAITFTEKAAGELRARIRARFAELGETAAARDMDGAWISTIHGFCARLLRANAVVAGLDPAFAVLDEATARQARAEAFGLALERFLDAGGDPALDLVATWGVDRLQDAIASVHDALRATGMTVPRLPTPPPIDPPAVLAARLRAARAAVDAERAGWRGGLKSLDAGRLTLDAIGAACDEDAHDVGLAGRVRGLKLGRQAKELKTDACDALRAALAALAQAEVDAEAVAMLARLDTLLAAYAAAYAAAKRARSAVDYDDLELLANDLLGAAPAVASSLRERFARIMVDEFQDTNPLQLQLLRHLDRGNVFLVGDALQSIYGFRHADVGVFRAERRRHEAVGRAPTLATNWRSRPALLEAVNAGFGALHEDYVPLVAAREPAATDEPLVELLAIDDVHDADGALDPAAIATLQAGMPRARNLTVLAEARAVARRIAQLVTGGETSAGDVAVLLRTAADVHVYERALELEGLSTLASGGRGFWLRQQVQDLTSYLAAIANPTDEAALLGVLASPLVGISSDGLAQLAAAAREQRRPLWAIVAAAGGAALGRADAAALGAFTAWFGPERAQAPLLPLDALVARAVRRTGYDLHVLGLAGGRRRLANVHKLERLAAEFEARSGRDVRAFIDHVAAEVEAEAREPDAPVELAGLDAVQLMTVHAAKGLEFGVVVVAGLGRQGKGDVPPILVEDGRVGLRLPRLHADNADALAYAELKAAAQQAMVDEERRIMHVAFTRAEERLIISGAVTVGRPAAQERAGGAPLTWVGRCVDPILTERLSPDAPELLVDRRVGPDRLHVAVRLVTPSTGFVASPPTAESRIVPTRGAQIDTRPGEERAEPGAGVQLDLGVAPPPAPAPARTASDPAAITPPPPPPTISYSSLTDHAGCGYRYYLRRVLGLPEQEPPPPTDAEVQDLGVPTSGLDKRVRGQLAHELLEAPDPAATTADDVVALAEEHDVELSEAEVTDLLQLANAFGATTLARRVASAVRVRREEPFAFALDDGDPASPLVNGFIDLVAVAEDGAWLVVDYKTNRVGDSDLQALVDRDYPVQRLIYGLAALRAGAPRAEVSYVFLERPDEPVTRTVEAADAPALTRELKARARPLLRGDFAVAARPHRELCAYCPGRGGMCSWPEEMSLRPAAAG